jgi:hypothetical protein
VVRIGKYFGFFVLFLVILQFEFRVFALARQAFLSHASSLGNILNGEV